MTGFAVCLRRTTQTNHSFVPNSEFVVFDHPRFGICPAIASIHSIAAGEEIFVRYGYDLDYCPDWYLAAWEKGRQSQHNQNMRRALLELRIEILFRIVPGTRLDEERVRREALLGGQHGRHCNVITQMIL